MADLSPEAQKLLDARTAAVAELKALDGADRSIKDSDVVRLANARLFEQNITMRMISGEAITSAEVRASDELVQNALKSFGQRIKVEVEIVHPTDGPLVEHCRRCGWKPGDDIINAPWSPPLADAQTATSDDGGATTPPSTNNVVKLRGPDRPTPHTSIHDHPDAPLKRLQPRISDSMFNNSPMSGDWSASHPLPQPPPAGAR